MERTMQVHANRSVALYRERASGVLAEVSTYVIDGQWSGCTVGDAPFKSRHHVRDIRLNRPYGACKNQLAWPGKTRNVLIERTVWPEYGSICRNLNRRVFQEATA